MQSVIVFPKHTKLIKIKQICKINIKLNLDFTFFGRGLHWYRLFFAKLQAVTVFPNDNKMYFWYWNALKRMENNTQISFKAISWNSEIKTVWISSFYCKFLNKDCLKSSYIYMGSHNVCVCKPLWCIMHYLFYFFFNQECCRNYPRYLLSCFCTTSKNEKWRKIIEFSKIAHNYHECIALIDFTVKRISWFS